MVSFWLTVYIFIGKAGGNYAANASNHPCLRTQNYSWREARQLCLIAALLSISKEREFTPPKTVLIFGCTLADTAHKEPKPHRAIAHWIKTLPPDSTHDLLLINRLGHIAITNSHCKGSQKRNNS